MKGWRTKLIFLLIVYLAGFATAIYIMAPAPEGNRNISFDQDSPTAKFNSEEFVKSFNTGIHKCLAFGKVAAIHTAEFLKEKIQEIREA